MRIHTGASAEGPSPIKQPGVSHAIAETLRHAVANYVSGEVHGGSFHSGSVKVANADGLLIGKEPV